ncbi:putative ATP-dependent zinc protease [Halobiforma nitratireducens]|uniref:Alpha-L-glutamate ligase n=1 Tax=Halobiforma nitratireducens JCM 10879 TaxID=1227454 RepID=M0MEH9_9EURY|nr:RimK/LysX family protein [Halobiforma nitratireducens]EMA43059.1 alpha-L-glutamate ligase [Halobiforma nitratireducens JCM 10879]
MIDDSVTVTVGVLSFHTSKETKAILNAVEELGHDTEWLRPENTSVSIVDGSVVLEPDVDVIANRMLLSNTEQPCEELGLANTFAQLVPTLNEPAAVLTAIHKLSTATALATDDVRTPNVTLALSNEALNAARDRYGEEAVYKTAIGTHGGGTWKVGADEPVNARVGNRYAFLQELVEQKEVRHRDLRVYVVEGDDGWFVLEVNPTAGFKGLYEATGVSPAPHIAKLAIERAGGQVDDERVAELVSVLDDSRPTAQPVQRTAAETEPAIVGYIEEVVLAGTSGSKTVLAKSDTGATRTSIDTGLAADIGAGPIKSITRVRSGSSKTAKSRPVVDVVVGVGGTQHTVTASVEDRSHMDYPVLLGRDILGNYRVDVSRRVDGDAAETAETEEEE